MPSSTVFDLMEACRQPGCPVCRVEQKSVERYLDNQFYENVNSPKWRDALRHSLGFCHEHAWLGVDKRLGDALGYSILYHDIVNSLLRQMDDEASSTNTSHRRGSFLRQIPEAARNQIERILHIFTPHKRCPACEHRDHVTRLLITALVQEIHTPEVLASFQASAGLCFPHLRFALEHVRDAESSGQLIELHRTKLEGLKAELAEFIRKSDYQVIKEGFGSEGDAWLRAIRMIAGNRKEK